MKLNMNIFFDLSIGRLVAISPYELIDYKRSLIPIEGEIKEEFKRFIVTGSTYDTKYVLLGSDLYEEIDHCSLYFEDGKKDKIKVGKIFKDILSERDLSYNFDSISSIKEQFEMLEKTENIIESYFGKYVKHDDLAIHFYQYKNTNKFSGGVSLLKRIEPDLESILCYGFGSTFTGNDIMEGKDENFDTFFEKILEQIIKQ